MSTNLKTPQIVASECDAAHYPQNSLSGFRHCLDQNIDGIEFDVHLTKDGVVVIQHDYMLNKRITRDAHQQYLAKTGPAICKLSLTEIKSFDIGRYQPDSAEAKAYPNYQPVDGERIPTLDELFDVEQRSNHSPMLWIEIKTSPFDRDISSEPDLILDAVLKKIEQYELTHRCVLMAFEWDILLAAKTRDPSIRTDFLTINPEFIQSTLRSPTIDPFHLYGKYNPSKHPGYAEAIAAAGGDWWGPFMHDINADDVAKARSLGIKVNVWGVDSTDDGIDAALALNADALTLSDPCLLQNRLRA